MSIKNILYTTLVVFLLIVVFSAVLSNSGNDSKTYKDELVIHTLSDAQGLNPVTISDATSR
ncbi:MAG TPA: hypothetical protein PK332_10625, partial [Chitinophagales bacterium]|nr:hypothetical protein [Chitinophagales bacterium]